MQGQRVDGAEGRALLATLSSWGLSGPFPVALRTSIAEGRDPGREVGRTMSPRPLDGCRPLEAQAGLSGNPCRSCTAARLGRTLPSVPGAALATPLGRSRAGGKAAGWLLSSPRLRRRRRRRHGERGLRRGQGGRLLRPAALPDAAAGGGARRVFGEPGCGASGTRLRRQAGGEGGRREPESATGGGGRGPGVGAARVGRASGARNPPAPHPPGPRRPPNPGPATPHLPARARNGRAAPRGAGPSPCWQWEEFEAAPGQVAGTPRLPAWGNSSGRGFPKPRGVRGVGGQPGALK